MDKNLLAAITGAVSAYLQQEQTGEALSCEGNMSNWWLSGQIEQMRTRTNTRKIKLQAVMSARTANSAGKDISTRLRQGY
jgi:uncharacterized protein YhjY with autotransporter beta-barrel domain